jgi:G:T-mismatch repair DNA endonuclease (very short patch repair protein)
MKRIVRDARKKKLLEKLGWRLFVVEDNHLSEKDVEAEVRRVVGLF